MLEALVALLNTDREPGARKHARITELESDNLDLVSGLADARVRSVIENGGEYVPQPLPDGAWDR